MSTCRDRMSDLFLKHRLGSPGDARLGPALHEPQRRLPVMDAGEPRRPVAHLRAVNRLHQRGAAGLLERGADLARHALELGIRHGETDAGLAEIGESGDVRGIIPRHHDGQRVGHVRHRRRREQARGDLGLYRLEAREVHVGLDRPGHVADGHPTAGADLAHQQSRRDRLPVQPAPVLRMTRLERLHQRRHGKEVVATDVQHEQRIGRVAVKIGEHICLRHREFEAAIHRIVVGSVLPRRIERVVPALWDSRPAPRCAEVRAPAPQARRLQRRWRVQSARAAPAGARPLTRPDLEATDASRSMRSGGRSAVQKSGIRW